MQYFFLLLLPYCLLSSPIKIATYNVQNLFDAQYNGTEYEEYIPGKHNWNRHMVEIKLNHTAEVICDVDADIMGLQEIENAQVFSQLLRRLKKVGCGYRYSAMTKKKGAPIQVALVSRYPIVRQRDIQVSYAPKVRNILEVEVDIQGKKLTLFVNHWKSKAYKGYESKRVKYARALQARIARMSPSKEYIILGDFNADYNAYLTLDEKNNDTHGKTGFSDILQTKIDEIDVLKAQKGVHYTLWKELPLDERWSHKFYGKKSSLDQIVLPQTMFDGKGIDYVNNSFNVFKADYLFTKRGYINAWRYKHGKHMAKGYSDHLPVHAYFDTHAYQADKNQSILHQIKTKWIEYFYSVEMIEGQIKVEDVVVLLKRGNHAIVKQGTKGRGIMLYSCAGILKEGHRYDILVESIKSYHGLKEINIAHMIQDKGQVDVEGYYATLDKALSQNEVVRDMIGIYTHRHFISQGQKWGIYFKKKKYTPPNGSKLKIHYAQIGYYKQKQLVVYSPKDFTILE